MTSCTAACGGSVDEAGDVEETEEAQTIKTNLLWQGNWSYLLSCDRYSRSAGRVVFTCDERPSRDFVDNGNWVAMPRAAFPLSAGKKQCQRTVTLKKGAKSVTARVVERSVYQKLRDALDSLEPRVEIPEEIMRRARIPLERMLAVR